jgi:hypothetical protein
LAWELHDNFVSLLCQLTRYQTSRQPYRTEVRLLPGFNPLKHLRTQIGGKELREIGGE